MPTARYEQNQITPTAALIYRPIEPVTVYDSHMPSLEQGGSAPQTAVNAHSTFAPTTDCQFELGAKAQCSRWDVNLALFRVDRGLQYLTSHNVFVQSGQTHYQGLDLFSQLTLVEHRALPTGMKLLDPRNLLAAKHVIGKRAQGAPRVKGKLQVEYAVPKISGLPLNAGGRDVGTRAVEADTSNLVGAYYRVDIGARYATALGRHTITQRAGIDHHTNEKYWLTSFGFILNQGAPRSVHAGATLTL